MQARHFTLEMEIYCTINRTSYYPLSFTSVTFLSHFSRTLSHHLPLFPLTLCVCKHPHPLEPNTGFVSDGPNAKWKRVGFVSGRSVRLDTIIWPGGDLSVAAVSSRARTVFRVVTALAPPFVMESELDEDGQCLRGTTSNLVPCLRDVFFNAILKCSC